MKEYEGVGLTEEAHIGQAKRLARRFAKDLDFNEQQIAEIDILIKEIGTNAIKFARGTGQLYFTHSDPVWEPAGLEIVYTDKGPGMDDPSLALEDGYTTTGTMGAGLGAIKRLADEFYIYSTPQSRTRPLQLYGRTTHGTAMVIKKHLSPPDEPARAGREAWGVFTRALAGESANGDAYVINRDGSRRLVAVIDGLGHGHGAHEASARAAAVIEENAARPVESILHATHEALRSTRGAVAGLAAIDLVTGMIEYAGVGNTDFRVLGATSLRFVSLNGTLGSRLERVRVFKERLPKVALIAMSTDGISERWDPASYPGLAALHPQLACAVVARDHSRSNDDATILFGRLSF